MEDLRILQVKYREDRTVRTTLDDSELAGQVETIVAATGSYNEKSSIDYSQLQRPDYERAKRNYNLSTASEPTVGRQEVVKPVGAVPPSDEQPEFFNGAVVSVDESLPYLISDIAFSEENVGYDKVNLWYYNVDDVVLDEDEVIVDNIDYTIGWDVFKTLDTQTQAWVRNDAISTDYEIVRVDGSYEELILGLDNTMTPAEKTQARMEYVSKRRKEGGSDTH